MSVPAMKTAKAVRFLAVEGEDGRRVLTLEYECPHCGELHQESAKVAIGKLTIGPKYRPPAAPCGPDRFLSFVLRPDPEFLQGYADAKRACRRRNR